MLACSSARRRGLGAAKGFNVEEHVQRPVNAKQPRLIAVGGGKGGVGKSCFAVNTAVDIARRGWRVVLFDGDLNCANVEALIGTTCAESLDSFLGEASGRELSDYLHPTPFRELSLLPSTSGALETLSLRYAARSRLLAQLAALDCDVVVIDLGAGAQPITLDLFLLQPAEAVVVITPERTAIDSAFRFLRAAFFRQAERSYHAPALGALFHQTPSLPALLERVREHSGLTPPVARRLRAELIGAARDFRPRIVVNKAVSVYQAQIAANILRKHMRQHLLADLETLGHVAFDTSVSDAVNCATPVLMHAPRQKAARCIVDLTNRLGYF